jgi:hypothetical protein
MKMFNAGRRTVVCLVALGLGLSLVSVASAARTAGAMQQTGGVRGDNGQILKVVVNLNGSMLKNVPAAVSITTPDGTPVITGKTSMGGTYSTPLDVGTYNVTVTTTHFSSTQSITIVQSTSPAVMTVDLKPRVSRSIAAPSN